MTSRHITDHAHTEDDANRLKQYLRQELEGGLHPAVDKLRRAPRSSGEDRQRAAIRERSHHTD